ncbi:AfsR/SARP family transcriptional regulator [Saccharothrix obliqua]|uniref:AfsR/SARP family transcriptional regulator n=1 Tax=Saccharothrix obliqua TaxID=2861747 RepID=UPI001C5FE34B|nr:BTAD domain-containing putative transcriptional regulator [Saccharothrix obliqua]MBW4717795.1 winged helix-turn-helix domain-containing protein [Saccharothrix obliqua]
MTISPSVCAEREVGLRLLGGTAVDGRAARGVVPGGVKARTLLAVLALEAGAAVSTERLLDHLWEVEPPRSAVKNLQLYVLRLRRCLDTAGAGLSRLLVRVGHGYRLDVPAEAVDALWASELARRGAVAVRAGAWGEAAGLLGAALADWPVDGLVGLVPSRPALAAATALRERRLAAVERLATAKLALGAAAEAADLLVAQAAAQPTRESTHVLLMRALSAVGDRAGAIAAYHRLWRALRDDFGIEPGRAARAEFDGVRA